MTAVAFYTLTFIAALAVLIIVHEFGHFLVAKWLGVRVLRFSVGFGPVMFSRWLGETEYAVSAIPFGGYVKMLGEDESEAYDPSESDRAFSAKPLRQRAAIVAAGPLFNIGFALVVYVVIHLLYGVAVPSDLPRVAEVTIGMPAAEAGLGAGDLITALDGEPVATWDGLAARIRESGGRTLAVTVQRGDEEKVFSVTPERRPTKDLFGERRT
jgi:regulator of sigma E protease